MWKKLLVFGSPLILLLELYFLNTILEFISAKNDIQVLVGISMICILAFLNYLLIKFYYKTFKTEKK